jgi:hypothetical protein
MENETEMDPAERAAARRYAYWHIGDKYWADQILEAYTHPEAANNKLDEVQAWTG